MRSNPSALRQAARRGSRRRAITLIELLVVIALIGILAGLGVMFIPGMGERARAARGGADLQAWLSSQRHKAVRDQLPRGLRLVLGATNSAGTTNGSWVMRCEYIEQPDDFTGGSAWTNGDNQTRVFFANVDLSLIQVGDYFEFLGSGLPHRITNVDAVNLFVDLAASPIPYQVNATPSYRIQRTPRSSSEERLELPDDVVIDLNTNAAYNNPLPTYATYVDILFSPSGQVITPGYVGESVNLWVRDSNQANIYDGEPTIVAVHRQTGLVTAHPPAPLPDPYAYVRDGRSSGSD